MYAITHNGKSYGPDGLITDTEGTPLETKDADSYNQEVERQELEWLKSSPDKVFLYVREKPPAITTWLGTVVSSTCYIGGKRYMGFSGYSGRSYRQSIDCKIFGVRYTGWYFSSTGNYCRLKKAKRQTP